MRYLVYLIFLGIMFGVSAGLYGSWNWTGYIPNFVLLIVVASALLSDSFDFLVISLVGGIWAEMMYGLPVGSYILICWGIGAITQQVIRQRLLSDAYWYHYLSIVAVAVVVWQLWLLGYSNILSHFHWSNTFVDWKQMLHYIVPSMIANVICAYPIFLGMQKLLNNRRSQKSHYFN